MLRVAGYSKVLLRFNLINAAAEFAFDKTAMAISIIHQAL